MCPFVVLYVAAVVVAGYWVVFYARGFDAVADEAHEHVIGGAQCLMTIHLSNHAVAVRGPRSADLLEPYGGSRRTLDLIARKRKQRPTVGLGAPTTALS
jgi:hypothetical protein